MRLIDFFVFYETTLYKNKEEEKRNGNQRLGKATRIAGMIVATWLITIIRLLALLLFKPNAINPTIWIFLFVAVGLITMSIMQNIYITNGRYEYIISEDYREFKLSSSLGVFIIFITFLISIAMFVAVGAFTGNF